MCECLGSSSPTRSSMQSLQGLWQPRKERPQHPAAAAVWSSMMSRLCGLLHPPVRGSSSVAADSLYCTNSSMWVGGTISPATSLVGSTSCCRRAATLPSLALATGEATPSSSSGLASSGVAVLFCLHAPHWALHWTPECDPGDARVPHPLPAPPWPARRLRGQVCHACPL